MKDLIVTATRKRIVRDTVTVTVDQERLNEALGYHHSIESIKEAIGEYDEDVSGTLSIYAEKFPGYVKENGHLEVSELDHEFDHLVVREFPKEVTGLVGSWEWVPGHGIAFAETNDPRVVALIERDFEAAIPDGCDIPPVVHGWYWEWGRARGYDVSCECYEESVSWLIVSDALAYFDEAISDLGQGKTVTERYLRIFHEVNSVHVLKSSDDPYAWALVFDTKAWREHVGLSEDEDVEGITDVWQEYLNGDVFSVGYAVNPDRVDSDYPFYVDEAEITLTCHGLYGEEWAKWTAGKFEYGRPNEKDMA